jgi:hypothetical protein
MFGDVSCLGVFFVWDCVVSDLAGATKTYQASSPEVRVWLVRKYTVAASGFRQHHDSRIFRPTGGTAAR